MENKLYYHGDMLGQIELVPKENYFSILLEFENLPTAENSNGFESCYIRQEEKEKIESRQIPISAFNELVKPYFSVYYDIVTYNYSFSSPTVFIHENAIAFGFEGFSLIVEFNTKNIITHIWINKNGNGHNELLQKRFITTLALIGEEYNLILIDWEREFISDFNNMENLKYYFNSCHGFNT